MTAYQQKLSANNFENKFNMLERIDKKMRQRLNKRKMLKGVEGARSVEKLIDGRRNIL